VNPLKRRLRWLETWLDARPVRERVLLAAGVVAVGMALWSLLLMDPLRRRSEELERQGEELAKEIEELEEQGRTIRLAHETDPNLALRQRAKALREQIESLDRSIHAHTVGMVTPSEMARFLEEMLDERTDLRLVRLENLGAEPLLKEPDPDAVGSARPGVFKHVFEVELEGRYLSALDYLEALEALPWSFFWEALAYRVEEHPSGRATIRAYTLSAEEDWIGV
jgi:MSHA biogenesis protein MshJ